jgi:hypothetical protein
VSGFAGTFLGTTDLNTVTTAGIYWQSNGGGATPALNYPALVRGFLEVFQMNATYIVQRYTNQNPVVFWERTLSSGTWGPWKAFTSQRVDQTAGRAIYTWDDVNNREQLIYGDTGWRNVSTLLLNGWTLADANSHVSINRQGGLVTLRLRGLVRGGATATQFLAMPSGFGAYGGSQSLLASEGGASVSSYDIDGGGIYRPLGQADTYAPRSVEIVWRTTVAWPTTLPGTAVGTIPNL